MQVQGSSRRGVPEWLIVSCGVWHIGLGLYFIFLRPALLPEDLRYMGANLYTLQAAVPRLTEWLGKVFTVVGGFMTGGGALIVYVGWTVMPARLRGTAWVLATAGALTLGLMSAVNFAGDVPQSAELVS
jgi:hypothetical protein